MPTEHSLPSALERALAVLDADAVDPKRAAMWRYGVRHTLTVVRAALAQSDPDWEQIRLAMVRAGWPAEGSTATVAAIAEAYEARRDLNALGASVERLREANDAAPG